MVPSPKTAEEVYRDALGEGERMLRDILPSSRRAICRPTVISRRVERTLITH
jgi:hypothetical protein